MRPVSSWGRLNAEPHRVIGLSGLGELSGLISGAELLGLPFGNGRSYGDVCLNPRGLLWATKQLDQFLAFDDQTGLLTCQAGVLIRDIQRLFIPRGWSLPVTPGTHLATVGGAIANDVHGKNHHREGSFGDHIVNLTVHRTDGEIIRCGPAENINYFSATVGGLGLTGVITQAEIQLKRVSGPWLETETIPYYGLDEFFSLADASELDWEHTVSWVDCLSGDRVRGLFMRGNSLDVGERSEPTKRDFMVPATPPFSLVNRFSLGPLNAAYFHLNKWRSGKAISHYEQFLCPLDSLLEWNRIYGSKGFYQHQSVVPREVGRDAVTAMLREIALSGEGSFLAVLKTFGNRQSAGMLGFPRQGVTLALDFPNHDEPTRKLFERLDEIVSEAKGRIYMAKDACMSRSLFEAGYPRFAEFLKYRDPGISSSLSRRLMEY